MQKLHKLLYPSRQWQNGKFTFTDTSRQTCLSGQCTAQSHAPDPDDTRKGIICLNSHVQNIFYLRKFTSEFIKSNDSLEKSVRVFGLSGINRVTGERECPYCKITFLKVKQISLPSYPLAINTQVCNVVTTREVLFLIYQCIWSQNNFLLNHESHFRNHIF